ncbi:flagellin [Massilia aerilata]|uniref:Flagellin n=1 Tax=Massilia aerilata TaxID=453817 RepID=A0ABW0RXB2_9BURK
MVHGRQGGADPGRGRAPSSINLASSQSRIQDVDYASTTAKLTRSQILQQAASAMLRQANGQPGAVLARLR